MESHSKPSSIDLESGTSPTVTPEAEQGSHISETEDTGKERPGGSIKKAEEKTSKQDESNMVDWDGPKDPENPLNWTSARKGTMIAIVSFLTFLSPLGSTIIAPATSYVMTDFHSTNSTLGSFVTSIYLLGFAFGPLALAPLSELYGRLPLYNVCNVLFLVFNIACAVAPNLGALLAFRLLAGLAGSCPVTIGAGSIADMVVLEQRGRAMAGWVIGPLVGPVTGPIIGGYLSQAAGWRWVFWLLSIVSGAACLITVAAMKESSAYIILQRKTRRLQKESGNAKLKSKLDTGQSPQILFRHSITRPVKMLFRSPIVFLLSLYTSCVYAYMYLCFTTFPSVFETHYGFSHGSAGLAYLGIGAGSTVGLIVVGALSDRTLKTLTARNNGTSKPEYRLPFLVVSAFLVPAGLFWYGWSAQAKVHFMVPIVGTSLLGAGMVIAFMTTSTYLVDAYTIYAASAIAAATVLRSILGALLPLAGPAMYSSLGVGWGTSVLAFVAVAMIPVPSLFLRYGERIRESNLFKVEW